MNRIAGSLLIITLAVFVFNVTNTLADSNTLENTTIVNKELSRAERAMNNEDLATALKIAKKYAEQGHAKAQYMYGHYLYLKFYMENYGKKMNDDVRTQEDEVNKETLKWMIKSANQGYVGGQAYLGGYYLEGDEMNGRQSEYVKGLMWSFLAAYQSKEKDSVESMLEEVKMNYDISDDDIKKARILAKQWKPVN